MPARAMRVSKHESAGSSRRRNGSAAVTTGRFAKGIWHCECSPRIPAERFQVKKQSANHGRWFYTCQKSKEHGCGFFLWDEDAKPREEAVLLHNSTSEPQSVQEDARLDKISPSPPCTSHRPEAPRVQPKKRKLPWERGSDDQEVTRNTPIAQSGTREYSIKGCLGSEPRSPTDADEATCLATNDNHAQLDSSQTLPREILALQTPRKLQKTSHYLPTPETTPQISKLSDALTNAAASSGLEPDTPTPSRFHDHARLLSEQAMTATRSCLGDTPDSFAEEVFGLMRRFDVKLDLPLCAALRALLDAEHRKSQGLARGREAARFALIKREARISELTTKVAAMETEREIHKAFLKHSQEVPADCGKD